MMIDVNVQGIPCKAEIVSAYYSEPDYSTWASDWDYYGGFDDIEFKIYDRRGRHAPWLERKLTEDDEKRITQQLIEDAKAE